MLIAILGAFFISMNVSFNEILAPSALVILSSLIIDGSSQPDITSHFDLHESFLERIFGTRSFGKRLIFLCVSIFAFL